MLCLNCNSEINKRNKYCSNKCQTEYQYIKKGISTKMNSKIILISGASQGIGKQTSIELAQNGYTIIANYNKSEQSAIELKNNFNIDIFKADVSKSEEIKQLVNYVLEKYKKIDVLINNAGISQTQLFTDITDNDWNKMINTNLYSCFKLTQNCLPNMIHNKSGCIINISSMWGHVGSSCESLYSITKAGIDAMTKSLAKELGPSGIRVNSIAPGFIDTSMNKCYTAEEIQNIIDDTPLEKIGQPSDISKCVKWLIEDNFTTGQIIHVNGGLVIN